MRKIKVVIEEHISQAFEVEAADLDEAMEIAEKLYLDGVFVVNTSNEPTAKFMCAEDDEELTDWVQF